jgi:alkaline phosphatase/streptomycin-6-phosphatase
MTLARDYYYGAAGKLEMDASSRPVQRPHTHCRSRTLANRITLPIRQQAVRLRPPVKKTSMRTGNITTAELTDATPAVLSAHGSSRRCQGPADIAHVQQRRGQAEALARSPSNCSIHNAAGLYTVHPGQRMLGLFNSGNMSLQCSGDPAVPFPGSGPQKCREFVRPLNEPGLLVMTAKTIALIDRGEASSPFFLQAGGCADREE